MRTADPSFAYVGGDEIVDDAHGRGRPREHHVEEAL
jgi:hypothetical protein